MADITAVQVGVCNVTFNGVDLGHSKGGVEFMYEPTFHEVSVDQFGDTMVEGYLTGEKIEVKVPMAEFTVANLGVAMPMGGFAGAANARRTMGTQAGKKLSTAAYQLVCHPIAEGTRRHDLVIHKAVVTSQVVLNHKIDEEKIIEVTFRALLDQTKSNNNYLGFIGDSTA